MRNRLILTSVVIALVAAACSGNGSSTTTAPAGQGTTPPVTTSGSAAETSGETAAAATEPCPTTGDEFETAKLYIEHNAPDEDTGVHGLFGGAAWSELCIWDPTGELILLADPLAQLNDLTVADLFFESREPENSEVSIADILAAAFPEGEYKVAGTDFEGVERVGAAIFTHDIPTEPEIVAPVLAEDPETASEATIPTAGLVVRWEPVTETIFGDPVVIAAYEVIVTKEDHEDPNSLSRPVYDVHIGPDQTALSVPIDFLEPDTIYELEVLALEESGNQTIGLGFFTTAGNADDGAVEFADVRAFIEYNSDGDDLGFHVEFDGDPWVAAALLAPDGSVVADLTSGGSLFDQGMSTNFFESAEYSADEVSREEFLARFPEGEYTLVGRSIEGEAMRSTATFTHLIPDPAQIVSPDEEAVVDQSSVTIDWEPVTTPAGTEPEVYQLQLFPVDPPEGTPAIDLNVDLTFEVPASVTELSIPPELLAPGETYEFELMVVDSGGNQTLAVGGFTTPG